MQLRRVLVLVFVLVGISFAQDTNFAVGPQYLTPAGNPMLLRPIATPSLSLGETMAGTGEAPTTVESPAFAPLETIVFLNNVYWGEHKPEEVVARRLEPPSMTPDQTALYMNAVASQAAPAAAYAETSEVAAGPSVIELTRSPMPTNLPASIMDVGFTGETNSQALVERGYGIPLGDVAAYWKAHKRTAPRVFKNADVVRPQGRRSIQEMIATTL